MVRGNKEHSSAVTAVYALHKVVDWYPDIDDGYDIDLKLLWMVGFTNGK